MATNILSVGTSTLDSSDVTIAAGGTLTVALKSPAVGARVMISLKDDAAAYQSVGELSNNVRSLVIVGAGTYRFSRMGGASCGVFSG